MVRKLAGYRDCDLCGQPAAEFVFAAGSRTMRAIDLCDRHRKRLQNYLKPFVEASRPPRRTESRTGRERSWQDADPEAAKIRAWARARGYHVANIGDIARDVRRAYYNSLE